MKRLVRIIPVKHINSYLKKIQNRRRRKFSLTDYVLSTPEWKDDLLLAWPQSTIVLQHSVWRHQHGIRYIQCLLFNSLLWKPCAHN